MGQVTDGSGHIIMLLAGKDQRYGFKGSNELSEFFYDFRRYFAAGSQDIIGILEKQSPGIDIAGSLAPCHRMPAYELTGQSCFFDMTVNIGFYTAYVGEQAGRKI